MTREEFIEILKDNRYSYEIEGGKIVVADKRDAGGSVYEVDVDLEVTSLPPGVMFKNEGYVWLHYLTSLPPGVEFRNKGEVILDSLTSLPPGVGFKNEGDVELEYVTSLPPGVEFKNGGYVWLTSLTSIPPGVVFNNSGSVLLKSIVGGYFQSWPGNIEGINEWDLLNLMISKGVFER